MQPHGRIDVSWRSVSRDKQDWLDLEWVESGVALVPEPGRQNGFGIVLITRRVPYELKGREEIELRPEGLQCRISFPLTPADSVLQTDIPTSARTRKDH